MMHNFPLLLTPPPPNFTVALASPDPNPTLEGDSKAFLLPPPPHDGGGGNSPVNGIEKKLHSALYPKDISKESEK